MKTFKDNAGRTWVLSIHVLAIIQCRAKLKVDLVEFAGEGFVKLGALIKDPASLFDVLWVLCEEQARKIPISDEDFARALAGDALRLAADAFVEELIDFFPDAPVREGLAKTVAASRKVQESLLKVLEAKLAEIDVDSLVRKLTDSSGDSPGSSGSIPGPSPSESST